MSALGRASELQCGIVNTQREFAWVIGPQTTGFIVGTKMTDDELLRIADAMHVAP